MGLDFGGEFSCSKGGVVTTECTDGTDKEFDWFFHGRGFWRTLRALRERSGGVIAFFEKCAAFGGEAVFLEAALGFVRDSALDEG